MGYFLIIIILLHTLLGNEQLESKENTNTHVNRAQRSSPVGNGSKVNAMSGFGSRNQTNETILKSLRTFISTLLSSRNHTNGTLLRSGNQTNATLPDNGEGVDEFYDERLTEKASMFVGVMFVPGMIALYIFCRYIPGKVIDACNGDR